jgi:hypothetical protein
MDVATVGFPVLGPWRDESANLADPVNLGKMDEK